MKKASCKSKRIPSDPIQDALMDYHTIDSIEEKNKEENHKKKKHVT